MDKSGRSAAAKARAAEFRRIKENATAQNAHDGVFKTTFASTVAFLRNSYGAEVANAFRDIYVPVVVQPGVRDDKERLRVYVEYLSQLESFLSVIEEYASPATAAHSSVANMDRQPMTTNPVVPNDKVAPVNSPDITEGSNNLSKWHWTSNARWGMAGIVVTVIVGWLSCVNLPSPTRTSTHSSNPKTTDRTALTQGQTMSAIDLLRSKHLVAAMDVRLSQVTAAEMPKGTYGYIYGFDLARSGDAKVYSEQDSAAKFELHKTPTGHLYILGFLDASDLSRLEQDITVSIPLTIYNQPYSSATNVAAIPLAEIRYVRDRDIPTPSSRIYAVDFKLAKSR